MHVKNLIIRQAVTFSPTATVQETAQLMTQEQVGSAVAVVEGKVTGIITERDLMAALGAGVPPETLVKDHMQSSPITVDGDTHVPDAADLMTEHQIRHLPVVDSKGELLGVISMRDIAFALVQQHAGDSLKTWLGDFGQHFFVQG